MTVSTNSGALARSGLSEAALLALASAEPTQPLDAQLILLNGAATIIYPDEEIERYVAMARTRT